MQSKSSKQFQVLQRKWYAKLKKSGFDDIETNDEYGNLKRWDGTWFRSRQASSDQLFFLSKQDYFYKAEHFLAFYAFKSKQEQKIWEYHARGLPYREIGKKVSKSKDVAKRVINMLRAIMLDEIKIRPAKAEDKSFIMATWLKGQYYGHPWFREIDKDSYNVNYARHIEEVIKRPDTKVNIACLAEDQDIILGYSVLTGSTLHWCYVKEAWRARGIANLLTQPGPITNVSGSTKTGKAISKKRGWTYNPWAL